MLDGSFGEGLEEKEKEGDWTVFISSFIYNLGSWTCFDKRIDKVN